MNNRLRSRIIFILLSLISFKVYAEPAAIVITAEQWAIPRHGERIVKLPEMRAFIQQWQNKSQQTIEISYPGGENGQLWLTELKDWLIALGISSANIRSIAGSGSKDIIKLTVQVAGGIAE